MGTYAVHTARSTYLTLAKNETSCQPEHFREWCEERLQVGERLAVDLFSGAGGLSLGLAEAGWTLAAAVDHYPAALETHAHNFGGLTLGWDLADPTVRDDFVGLFDGVDVDLVAGGPPCQPFSRAGRSKIRSLVDAGSRPADDPRRQLWRAFLEIAERLHPRAVLMENVPDMGLGDDFHILREMSDKLENNGYRASLNLVDAWNFGVPQHRQRMILLARRDGREMRWPAKQDKVVLEDVLDDLPDLSGGVGSRRMPYSKPPRSPFEKAMRAGAGDQVTEHMTRAVRSDDREIFKGMSPTTLYSQVPAELRRYRADSFTDKYHRLDRHGLSRSITAHIAKDGYWYIHPWENRTLTVREAARIQTFPDRFRFAGTRSDAFKQIGNAVPPLLGKAAASALDAELPPAAGTTDVGRVRAELDRRATELRNGELQAWFPNPETVTPLTALALAVQARLRIGDVYLARAVKPLLGKKMLTAGMLQDCYDAARTDKQRISLARLEPLENHVVSEEDERIDQEVRLSASEFQLFRLLCGHDVLLRSQACFRVAAQLLGVDPPAPRKGTAALLELARIVGSGDGAPRRMAMIRLLAMEPSLNTVPIDAFRRRRNGLNLRTSHRGPTVSAREIG